MKKFSLIFATAIIFALGTFTLRSMLAESPASNPGVSSPGPSKVAPTSVFEVGGLSTMNQEKAADLHSRSALPAPDVETLRWSVSPHPDGPPGRLYKCAGAAARSTGILPVAQHGRGWPCYGYHPDAEARRYANLGHRRPESP